MLEPVSVQFIPVQEKPVAITSAQSFREYIQSDAPDALLLRRRYQEITIAPIHQQFLGNYPEQLHLVVIIAEEFPDTISVLPILAHLANMSMRLELGIYRDSDDLAQLAELVPSDEFDLSGDLDEIDLPLLLIFDEEWQYQANWGPRPQAADEQLERWLEANPHYEILTEMHAENGSVDDSEDIDPEIDPEKDILELDDESSVNLLNDGSIVRPDPSDEEADDEEADDEETDEAETDEAETDEAETDEAETDEAEIDEAEIGEAEIGEAEIGEAEIDGAGPDDITDDVIPNNAIPESELETFWTENALDAHETYTQLLYQLTHEMRLWYNSGLNQACMGEVCHVLSELVDDEEFNADDLPDPSQFTFDYQSAGSPQDAAHISLSSEDSDNSLWQSGNLSTPQRTRRPIYDTNFEDDLDSLLDGLGVGDQSKNEVDSIEDTLNDVLKSLPIEDVLSDVDTTQPAPRQPDTVIEDVLSTADATQPAPRQPDTMPDTVIEDVLSVVDATQPAPRQPDTRQPAPMPDTVPDHTHLDSRPTQDDETSAHMSTDIEVEKELQLEQPKDDRVDLLTELDDFDALDMDALVKDIDTNSYT
ncbi:MAG: thioredoxin family protein [Chloroflexota bacterium]